MRADRRRVVVASITAAALAVLAGVIAFGARPPALPVYWPVPEFALVDQANDTVRTADLRGTVWLASFIFTHCTDLCPLVTHRMSDLRDSLQAQGELGTRVRLLSFSVDPARDTPAVLREYAGKFGGSPPGEWAFLTGNDAEEIRRMIQDGFHLGAVTVAAGPGDTIAGYQVMHSPRLLLIDQAGQVRGTYRADEPEAMRGLAADLRRLLR